MPDTIIPVGQRFKSHPCSGCGCRATGIVKSHLQGTEVVAWEEPPMECECECHAAWHMVHHTTASGVLSLSQGVD